MNNVDYVEYIIKRLRECYVPEWALEPLESWVEQERANRLKDEAGDSKPKIMHSINNQDGNEICPRCRQEIHKLPKNDIGRYCVHGNWQISELSRPNDDETPRHYAYVSCY